MFSVITRSEAVSWLLVWFGAHIKITILHCIVAKITTTATQHTGPFSLTMYWSSFLVGSLENSQHKEIACADCLSALVEQGEHQSAED